MSYFNHAFKKTFVATKPTQVSGPNAAGVTDGILTDSGIHVSELKNTAAPFQLGPGVVGFFNAATHESMFGQGGPDSDCCPFYIAGAAIKLNDKQGPFHGGYQESNKSKMINPKYIRRLWMIEGNAASRAVLEIGGTPGHGSGAGSILTLDIGSLVAGTGYIDAIDVPVTGGTGAGATVDITTVMGVIDTIVINNPGTGYTIGDTLSITGGNDDAEIDVETIDEYNPCIKEFMCGESYYLRIDVKGTPALRFANHNLYRTLQADGGCCEDPVNPVAIDPAIIYKQWANMIAEDPYLKDFVRPVLVIDNQSYFYTAEIAVEEGFAAGFTFANAPDVSAINAGLILLGAYVDTTFGDCTFQTTDYYGIQPIQIFASEVDLSGDPCTFETLCVTERCPGMQANGTGEQKVRELILSESYLQNFVANDLRIREITQGTRAYEILNRAALYSSYYILHSVPRFNNPTGVFDNDQYLLEIVGSAATLAVVDSFFEALADEGCINCMEAEDFTGTVCTFRLPDVVVP